MNRGDALPVIPPAVRIHGHKFGAAAMQARNAQEDSGDFRLASNVRCRVPRGCRKLMQVSLGMVLGRTAAGAGTQYTACQHGLADGGVLSPLAMATAIGVG